jgi:hypothetical protein
VSGIDVSVQRDFLDALYGPVTGDVTVHLYSAHVDAGGVEIDFDGYAPGTVPDTGWEPAASDGVKTASSPADCGTPTEAATPDTATHYVLRNLSGDACGCFKLQSPLTIGSAGSAVEILPAVFFGENDN